MSKRNPTGEAMYRCLTDYGRDVLRPEQGISQKLYKAGIPGIKYLDQGSRGGGKGTSNFVLFDDKTPKILEMNGKKVGERLLGKLKK
jgi:hypothetical protein